MQFIGLGRVERTRQHFFTNLLRHDDIVSQDMVKQDEPPDLAQRTVNWQALAAWGRFRTCMPLCTCITIVYAVADSVAYTAALAICSGWIMVAGSSSGKPDLRIADSVTSGRMT